MRVDSTSVAQPVRSAAVGSRTSRLGDWRARGTRMYEAVIQRYTDRDRRSGVEACEMRGRERPFRKRRSRRCG